MSRLKGVTTVVVLLCLGVVAYGCGGSDGASQEELDAARAEGAKQARQTAKLNQLQKQVRGLQKQAKSQGSTGQTGSSGSSTSSTSSGGVKSCGGGVSAGANTTCEFAMNVAGEKGSNPGASTIQAYSPVTGQYYTMHCSYSGGGTLCTGGNNASVYLP